MSLGKGLQRAIWSQSQHQGVVDDAAEHVAVQQEGQPADHLALHDRKKHLVLLWVVIMGISRFAGWQWSGFLWRPTGRSELGVILGLWEFRMDIDPRVVPWRKRQREIERLEVLRIARASVCGCSRCGNDATGKYLDGQIRRSEQLVAQYDDECCDRLPDNQRLQAMERTHTES